MMGPIERAWERLNAQDPEGARKILRQALARAPGMAAAHALLGMIHSAHHEDAQAFDALKRATACDPSNANNWFMLGNAAMILKRHDEGAKAYARCVALAPMDTRGHDGLGKCLISLGRRDEAIAIFEESVARTPGDENAWGRYASTLLVIGMVRESLAVLERGMRTVAAANAAALREAGHAISADAPQAQSALLVEQLCYSMNFLHDASVTAHRAAHELLGKIWAQRATRPPTQFPVSRAFADPERPLRIGVLSGDFCGHACGWFLEGPLGAWDHSRDTLFMFTTLERDDAVTARFKSMGNWRPCGGMTDDQLAATILADHIDVLIECAGWTEGNRLRALVPRVAPVQATYLGYPNTTGIPTMDYRIVDWHTDPAGAEIACTETLQRLDRCFVCFRPHDQSPAATLTAAMRDDAAPICFASFNRVTKLSEECVAMWSRVLRETSGADGAPPTRLLLKSAIVSEETRRDAAARFASHGVDPSRVDLVPYADNHVEHLAMYGLVDIALDTFPYHGTTTTCEATWMGVPVLTRAGDAHRSRVGVSLLTTIGAPELIAHDADDFVAKAAELSRNRARLREYRTTLRETMRASPLCDARGHARALQDATRAMWRQWCARIAT